MKCSYCGQETEGRLCGKCKRVIEQMVFTDILDANTYCRNMGWVSYQITYTGKGYKVNELEGY